MTPSNQESGEILDSRTKLKKHLYSGNIIIPDVLLIYSFIILLLEDVLLYFKDFIHFKISAPFICEFKISLLLFKEGCKSSID